MSSVQIFLYIVWMYSKHAELFSLWQIFGEYIDKIITSMNIFHPKSDIVLCCYRICWQKFKELTTT